MLDFIWCPRQDFLRCTQDKLTSLSCLAPLAEDKEALAWQGLPLVVPPAGLEPATPGLGIRSSIRLSYGGI